jgi:hypothetical protein
MSKKRDFGNERKSEYTPPSEERIHQLIVEECARIMSKPNWGWSKSMEEAEKIVRRRIAMRRS